MRVPFGEFLPDQQDMGGMSSRALNVYPTAKGYTSFPSLQPISNPLDGLPSGAIFARSQGGDVSAFAGTETKLYELDTTVTDVSKPGGYTVIDSETWTMTQWGDQVLATNYFDPIQVKNLGSSANFDDLDGDPPNARAMAVVGNFLMLGNTNDSVDGVRANRVFWSGFENIEQWSPGINQSDFQDLQGNGGEVQRIFGGEYGVVFQERSIWRVQYVGAPLVFQFDEIERGRGTPVPRSCVQFGRSIYYLGRDGFYELVDGSYSRPIGAEKIDRYFQQDFDTDFKYTMSSTVDPLRNIVIWSYAGAGHSGGIPNKALIYNWETGQWSAAEFGTSLVFHGATLSLTLDELDQFGTLDSLPYSLDSRAWKRGNELLAGFTQDYRFGFFDGAALTAEIDTTEIGGENRSHIKSVRPHIQGTNATDIQISIGGRNKLTDVALFDTPQGLDSTGKANVRNNKRYQRVRAIISGDFEHANEISVDVRASGKR